MAASLDMARAASSVGVGVVVATPHLRADFPLVEVAEIAERVAVLQAEIDANRIDLVVLPGAEVSLSWAATATDELLRLATVAQRSKYILIETPTAGAAMMPRLLYEVACRGVRVILAHPERLPELCRDDRILDELVEQGVLFQINADSVLDRSRESPAGRSARLLFDRRLVTAVASDAHRGFSWRPITQLADARTALASRAGEPLADWVISSAPAALVAGAELPPAPATQRARRGFLRRR
jgi:protein-tyrosine phosphatase